MYAQFYHYFYQQICRTAPSETLLAEEIAGLIGQSRANAYKKLRGQVPFSTDEVLALAKHFRVSLDRFLHNGHADFEKISFDYSLPSHQVNTPETFLEKIERDLEQVSRLPQALILYATNEIPLFHSIACRSLLAFKLYVWSRTNWRLADGNPAPKFGPEAFYAQWPGLNDKRLSIAEHYRRLPSKEYWSRTVLSNILNQIRYYEVIGAFETPAVAETLRSELSGLLGNCATMATNGKKSDNQTGSPFDLYLNEIAYTNNIILVCREQSPIAVYTTMDNPNFLRSDDPAFCQRMYQWVRQVETCSFHTGNERHRLSLFGKLLAEVEEQRR
jgi:BetR domain.